MRSTVHRSGAVASVTTVGLLASSILATAGGYALIDGNGTDYSLGATGLRATAVESKNYFIVMEVDR